MLRYNEYGLRNVWLRNGYTMKQTRYGKAVVIQDVEGLHRVIAKVLTRKPKLSGAEFRFLRKEMGLSQEALGRIFGCHTQTIARWEKNMAHLPKLADRMLRLIWREHAEGKVKIREVLDGKNDAGRRNRGAKKIVLVETKKGWIAKAA